MKENTNCKRREMRGMYFLGAAAYGFTHMPIMLVQEVKKERKERKLNKYKKALTAKANWLVKNGNLDADAVGEWLTNSIELVESCSRWH